MLVVVKKIRVHARDFIFACKSGCLGSSKPFLFPSPRSGLSSSKSEIESRVRLKRPQSLLSLATDCFALFGVRAFYWGERALIHSPCTCLRSANEKIYSNHTTRWIFDHSSGKRKTATVYLVSFSQRPRSRAWISFPMDARGKKTS